MAIGSPCFISRFSNIAFHFFQSPLLSASPSPALPKAKKQQQQQQNRKRIKKKQWHFRRVDWLHISPSPTAFFVRGWGGRHRLSGTFSSQQKRAFKTISCGQYFTEIVKHRDNYEIILWVPISSLRLQILLCPKKKKAISKLIMKESQNSDLPYCNRHSLQGK